MKVLHLMIRGQFEGERMHATRWLTLLFCALFLAACGGGGDSSPPPAPPVADNDGSGDDASGDSDDDGACGVSAQIDFVEAVTDEWYLWYDEMASVDKGDYDSAQAYLDARLRPLIDDGRGGFSPKATITPGEADISPGASIGLGFRNDSAGVFITGAFERGPAWEAGMGMGKVVVAVG